MIPSWAVILIYLCGFVFLAWIGYRGYRNAVNLVGHVTGLDLERSRRLYDAALTGNWTDIPTEDLKYDPLAAPRKGIRSKFIDQLQAQITTERVRREIAAGTHELLSGQYREGLPPEIKEAMERRKREQTLDPPA